MPDPASFSSSEFDDARAEDILQESAFVRPNAEIRLRPTRRLAESMREA
jgi:hypothetical protein